MEAATLEDVAADLVSFTAGRGSFLAAPSCFTVAPARATVHDCTDRSLIPYFAAAAAAPCVTAHASAACRVSASNRRPRWGHAFLLLSVLLPTRRSVRAERHRSGRGGALHGRSGEWARGQTEGGRRVPSVGGGLTRRRGRQRWRGRSRTVQPRRRRSTG